MVTSPVCSELRDRAARAGFEAYWQQRDWDTQPEVIRDKARRVVDAVAEVLAEHRPKVARTGRGSWRPGRKVGRTIYRQVGDDPSDDDVLIGVMDTTEDAMWVCISANCESPGPDPSRVGRLISENERVMKLAQERDEELFDFEVRVAEYSRLLRGMARLVGEQRGHRQHYATRLMEAHDDLNRLERKLSRQRKRRKAAEAKVDVLETMIRSYRDCLLLTRLQLDDARKELPDE